MSDRYPIPRDILASARTTRELYTARYQESILNPEKFWSEAAREVLTWESDFHTTLKWDFSTAHIEWFIGGKLNVSVNCLDRHLPHNANKAAIVYEGNEPGEGYTLTYSELHREVIKAAAALRTLGVKKGDRVAIYLPMIPEAAISMLACARIGAIHTVVFGGFSSESLASRINDCGCSLLITANEGLRGGKGIPLKETADEAVAHTPSVKNLLVVKRTESEVSMTPSRDIWWHDATSSAAPAMGYPEVMDSEDPLFILYTSGSTGKPKGVLHTTAGYLLHAAFTHREVFDLKEGDIFFCGADVGWITGHTYVVYGPLANGSTTLLFESLPTYPDASRYWDVVERHKVTILYTAPTAIRALAKEGDEPVKKHDRSTLRILGSVGEPINPDAWRWYHSVVGEGRCAIVDTWWQTETGGAMISPIPGATEPKPGSATLPLFGVQPCLVDEGGKEIEGNGVSGRLCIKFPWPGMMRTVYGDHSRFVSTYFATYPGYYFTGDGCTRDEDGYYWITGRVDDVLNVAGHRLGTAEIEGAIVRSGVVAEAAVVGAPHDIKGQGVCAFCVLKPGLADQHAAEKGIIHTVREVISPIASPDWVYFVSGLPKTRSGKIMRRILRKVAEGEYSAVGDTTTLAEPSVVEEIITLVKASREG